MMRSVFLLYKETAFLCYNISFFLFQMGAKKAGGMGGAQKVKKDFAEIEREAELADQVNFKTNHIPMVCFKVGFYRVLYIFRRAFPRVILGVRHKQDFTNDIVSPKKR